MKKRGLILLIATIFLSLSISGLSAQGKLIALDKPDTNLGVDLMKALELRKSTKSFSSRAIKPEDMADILWAANGVNRENGKRTAPSSYGKYYINIYVAGDDGVYRYDPMEHQLILVTEEHIKTKMTKQDYPGEASHILIFTTNLSGFHPMVSDEAKMPTSWATVGFIGQNVYLTTNAMNMGACFVVGIKGDVIETALDLQENEVPLCVMPIGYPEE